MGSARGLLPLLVNTAPHSGAQAPGVLDLLVEEARVPWGYLPRADMMLQKDRGSPPAGVFRRRVQALFRRYGKSGCCRADPGECASFFD